jgi:anti-sigma-K factor RskA
MANDALHELTAGYALDALDAAESRAYERHLAHCPRCQEELAALSVGASALAFAAKTAEPSAALRERILEAAHAERPNVIPFRRPAYGFPRVTALVAVAASCAAIGLGLWSVVLSNRLDRSHEALRGVTLHGAAGSVVLGASGQGTLVVAGLKPAPAGKTYEAWVIQDGKAAPAGIFRAGGKTVVLRLGRPVPKGAVVAVTVERAGGSEQPTMRPFITSSQV